MPPSNCHQLSFRHTIPCRLYFSSVAIVSTSLCLVCTQNIPFFAMFHCPLGCVYLSWFTLRLHYVQSQPFHVSLCGHSIPVHRSVDDAALTQPIRALVLRSMPHGWVLLCWLIGCWWCWHQFSPARRYMVILAGYSTSQSVHCCQHATL